MAFCSTENEYGYDDRRFQKDVDQHFHCSICYNVLKEPRMCHNNEHMFCLACITRNLVENSESCPECNEDLTVNTLRPAPRVVNNYLSELKIKCDFASRGCPEFIRLEALKTHVASCGFAPVLCSNENCCLEINKREKVYHQSEVCEYRKVKCHDCEQIQEMVEVLEENVEVVKNEIENVKDDLSKVNRNMAELKVMMTQLLDKMNMFQYMPQALPQNIMYIQPQVVASRSDRARKSYQANSRGFQDISSLRSKLAKTSIISDQKQMLGECLFPLIQQSQPDSAGKITGMLLEMDNSEILRMLEAPEALAAKIQEAVTVLQAHAQRELYSSKVRGR